MNGAASSPGLAAQRHGLPRRAQRRAMPGIAFLACSKTLVSPPSRVNQMNGISSSLKMDCDRISQWFLDKLNEGTATSGLMIVTTGEEGEAHSYGLNTVSEAIELAHAHLTSKYKNADRYVIAYDAGWYNSSGIEQRAIFVEAEERTTASPRLFVYRILPTTGPSFSFTNEIFEFKTPEWSLYKTPLKK